MIYDALDLLNPKPRFTAEAVFYESRPEVEGGGVHINYEYVSPYSATYRRLFANIQGEDGEVAIRTNDFIKPVVNKSHVLLADGRLFYVKSVEVDYQAAEKQALRLFGVPLSTEYVLRLIPEDNSWGVK